MKLFNILTLILISLFITPNYSAFEETSSKFSTLSPIEKSKFIDALKSGACEYKGVSLWGKVQFVDAFEDISITYVDAFEDIRVQFVNFLPNQCGQWQEVTAFPDFKVKVVSNFGDLKVKKVKHFPGMN